MLNDDHAPMYLVAYTEGFTLCVLHNLGTVLGLLKARGIRVTSVTPEAML